MVNDGEDAMKRMPKGRTLAEFQPLKSGEAVLLQACADGEVATLDRKRPTDKSAENTVRASFIRFMALGGDDEAPIHEQGVHLMGAWIEGELNLNGTVTPTNLSLRHSHFEAIPLFEDSEIAGILSLDGSLVPGVNADRAVIKGSVFLSNGFTSTGSVRLLGAQIGNDLECQEAKLDGNGGNSLSADRAVIKGSVFLSKRFTATGSVRLLGAQIGSDLECQGAKLDGNGGHSLSVERAVIKGNVFLSDGFSTTGEVRLAGAQVGGNLSCKAAKLDGRDGNSLSADNAVIKGTVFLSSGFAATGGVWLLGTQIGSNLECHDATLDGKNGNSLSADGAVIKGSIFLSNGFSATGEVRLLRAQVGGNLSCKGAKLDGKGGYALSMDRAVINGSVFLSNGFTATGGVRLLGAQIGGNLSCQGAMLDGGDGNSLSADGAVIKGNVSLSDGFTATGSVRLLGAQIGGNLECQGAKLDSRDGSSLSADGMSVGNAFVFRGLGAPAQGVSLASAKVGRLIDDADSWGVRLALDGFVYGHLAGGAPTDALARLSWLSKQRTTNTESKEFPPQPWKQLQVVLRGMGHREDARQVAIAFEDRLRSANLIGQTPMNWPTWTRSGYRYIAKGMHVSFKMLIGYGYRPMRLAGWMLAVWLLCASLYWWAALQGVMAPSNPLVFQHKPQYQSCTKNWYLCNALPEEYTGFSPLTYSLDVLLPLVNLQQEQDWAPLIPTPKDTWHQELFGNWSFKHFVRVVVWFEILFGWVASLLLVAVVSGLTKRSEGE
jgi:sRNA-binding regulator protein Hfq